MIKTLSGPFLNRLKRLLNFFLFPKICDCKVEMVIAKKQTTKLTLCPLRRWLVSVSAYSTTALTLCLLRRWLVSVSAYSTTMLTLCPLRRWLVSVSAYSTTTLTLCQSTTLLTPSLLTAWSTTTTAFHSTKFARRSYKKTSTHLEYQLLNREKLFIMQYRQCFGSGFFPRIRIRL